jgi:RNA polymerase sigma-70 factor (ECF subfamily)
MLVAEPTWTGCERRDTVTDGGAARFERLYAAAFQRLLGYALRRCAGPEDAAGVVAETFAIAWRRLAAVPHGDEALLWLYGVVRNVLANHRRGVARQRALSARLAAEVVEMYEQQPSDSAELRTIRRVFGTLPAADQELLALVGWEGLDHGEIATVLGCTRNAVRIRLHRARKRLARELTNAGVPTDELTVSGRLR